MSNYMTKTLLGYSAVHGIVDFSCATLLFAVMRLHEYSNATAAGVFVLYNVCAFGLQFLLGMVVDRYRVPKESAFLGVAWILYACFFTDYFVLVALISGIGNALFHVGAGSISLNIAPGKVAPVGVFIAPGFVGLTVGTLFGQSESIYHFPVVVGVLVASLIFLFFVPVPQIDYARRAVHMSTTYFSLAILCILLAVSMRAFYRFQMTFPWDERGVLFVLLVSVIVCGKVCGGFVADRYGWMRVSVVALVCAALLVPFFPHIPVVVFVGIWCFHLVTPVIFALMGRLFPGYSARAFGTVETVFACGSVPLFVGIHITTAAAAFGVIAVSAFLLLVGMKIVYTAYSNM